MSKDMIGFALQRLNQLASHRWFDDPKRREMVGNIIFKGTQTAFKTGLVPGMSQKSTSKNEGDATTKPSSPLFDLSLDDDQQMMQDSLARFSEEAIRPLATDANHANQAPSDLLEMAAELGLAAVNAPEAMGGAGETYSATTQAIVYEALAYGDMGLAVAILAPVSCANILSLYGTSSQQNNYLKPLLAEKPVQASLAINEPRPLFDAFELKTTAKSSGKYYVLDGQKSLVALGQTAQFFIVAATIEHFGGKKTPALFLVDRQSDGLSVTDEPGMGLRAAALSRVKFDHVKVPQENRLGCDLTETMQHQLYQDIVIRSRLAWCALAVGTGKAVVDYVIPYVNERVAFGEPVSHRQSVAFKVADMATELDAMRLLLWRATSLIDQHQNFVQEAALAKKLATDKGMMIGNDGVQLLGGHGFVMEHPVERWYRDLRAVGVMDGIVFI